MTDKQRTAAWWPQKRKRECSNPMTNPAAPAASLENPMAEKRRTAAWCVSKAEKLLLYTEKAMMDASSPIFVPAVEEENEEDEEDEDEEGGL